MKLFIIALFVITITPATYAAENDIDAHAKSRAQSLYAAIKHKEPKFSLSGKLTKGSSGEYLVNGETFSVASDALIHASLKDGEFVNVRGIISHNKKIAKKIQATSSSDTISIKKNSQALD